MVMYWDTNAGPSHNLMFDNNSSEKVEESIILEQPWQIKILFWS
jgi:hypothetical protein